MPETITDTSTLVVEECWCGIRHAIPSNLSRRARERGVGVYCPLGHEWFKKRTELDRTKDALARERAAADRLRAERDHAEASRRAQKAATTRLKRRVEGGVCPHCTRTFQNVRRHIQTCHTKETAAQ